MLKFDFSTLPKVKAYGQMGGLSACTWYTPWDCSVTDVDKASDELAQEHNRLIDFGNALARLRDDAVAGGAPQQFIDGFSDSLNKQYQLVQQHTALMNEFYSKTGSGVSGLARSRPMLHGLSNHMGLGFAWLVALPELAVLLGYLGRAIYLVWVTQIVGEAATAYKTNAESNRQEAINRADCYKLYREAQAQGKPVPNCVNDPSSTDWTTIALIGGSVVLAALLLGRR